MLELRNLWVQSHDDISLDLYWEFDVPSGETVSDYRLNVYRCESPSSDITEYDGVDSGINPDNTYYPDTEVIKIKDNLRTWYYKLGVYDVNSGETNDTIMPEDYPAYLEGGYQQRQFLQILKGKRVTLGKSGRPLYILKRRTGGERCEEAGDPILYKETDDETDCETGGTGFKGGYFAPIKVTGMISTSPDVREISRWGEFYPSDSVLTILNKPPLVPQDIVVDLFKAERWKIQQVQTVEMHGRLIEQQAQISKIHPDDEIYAYPIEESPYSL